jgi:hypothetical protein
VASVSPICLPSWDIFETRFLYPVILPLLRRADPRQVPTLTLQHFILLLLSFPDRAQKLVDCLDIPVELLTLCWASADWVTVPPSCSVEFLDVMNGHHEPLRMPTVALFAG